VSTYIGVTSTSYQVEKRDWLLGLHGTDPGATPSATLDVSLFTGGTHYPNGYIPSGTVVSRVASGSLRSRSPTRRTRPRTSAVRC
jgi:hypothetical protein